MLNLMSGEGSTVKKLASVLSSDAKTGVVTELGEGEKTFSELQKKLKMTSGNLNYHLLGLHSLGLVSKKQKAYVLTVLGQDVVQKVKQATA